MKFNKRGQSGEWFPLIVSLIMLLLLLFVMPMIIEGFGYEPLEDVTNAGVIILGIVINFVFLVFSVIPAFVGFLTGIVAGFLDGVLLLLNAVSFGLFHFGVTASSTTDATFDSLNTALFSTRDNFLVNINYLAYIPAIILTPMVIFMVVSMVYTIMRLIRG